MKKDRVKAESENNATSNIDMNSMLRLMKMLSNNKQNPSNNSGMSPSNNVSVGEVREDSVDEQVPAPTKEENVTPELHLSRGTLRTMSKMRAHDEAIARISRRDNNNK